jgi:hypothetical protein
MGFAEVLAGLMKALLSVSVLGVILKFFLPNSRLFRSHRHDEGHAKRANDPAVGLSHEEARRP